MSLAASDYLPSPSAGELDVFGVLWEEQLLDNRPLKLSEIHKRVCLGRLLQRFRDLPASIGRFIERKLSRVWRSLCQHEQRLIEAGLDLSRRLRNSGRASHGRPQRVLGQRLRVVGPATLYRSMRSKSSVADSLGNPYWRASNLYGLGLCNQMREYRDQARRHFDEALALAEQLHMPLADKIRRSLEEL